MRRMICMDQPRIERPSRYQQWLLLVGIVFVSINLRPAITALSPLAERLYAEGMSRSTIGLLSTIPLILFGAAGLMAGWIGGCLGLARTLGWGLLTLALGCFLRSIGGQEVPLLLWTGTVLIGAGISMGNVLLPSLVKSRFPNQVGWLTSVYSTALNLGAAMGIAISVPIADHFDGSWRISLSTWGIVALVSFAIWLPQFRKTPTHRNMATPFSGLAVLVRKKRAWQVAFFMGIQSTVFYASMMWLPTVLQWRGMSESNAATWATFMQVLGGVASLVTPAFAARQRSQSNWIVGSGLCSVLGLIGILFLPKAYVGVSTLLLGVGLNASFGLVLLTIALRSKNHETAAVLSSLSQAFGYLFASIGPWLAGVLSLTSFGWYAGYGFIILLGIINLVIGWFAGREGELELRQMVC